MSLNYFKTINIIFFCTFLTQGGGSTTRFLGLNRPRFMLFELKSSDNSSSKPGFIPDKP